MKRDDFDWSIRLLAAQNPGSYLKSAPSVYVKCELHVESEMDKRDGRMSKESEDKPAAWKRRSSGRNSHEPDWAGQTMRFDGVRDVLPEISFVRCVLDLCTSMFCAVFDPRANFARRRHSYETLCPPIRMHRRTFRSHRVATFSCREVQHEHLTPPP